MHDIILFRALDLTYAKEPVRFKDRILGRADGLMIKDVTFHLYKGEVLGILSEDYETLYYLKELAAGTLDPTQGRVKTKSSMIALDVMDHVNHPHPLNIFVHELLDEYMNPADRKTQVESLKNQPLFRKNWHKTVSTLSRRETALILIQISNVVDVDIIIYCNLYNHLNEQDKENFRNTVNDQEKKERGVLLLESDIEPISTLANYFLWLSYGQIRYDGSVKKGVDAYSNYMKKKSQLKSTDEEVLFDLEWKQNISEYARYKHELKRLSKNQTSFIDSLNIRKIIVSAVLVFFMMLSSLIIFMDINFTGSANTDNGQTQTEPDEENAAGGMNYGIVSGTDVEAGGENLPYLTTVQISSESPEAETYEVVEEDEIYEVSADNIIYFNPASLYQEVSLSSLLPYTHETLRDNYLFYTGYLGGGTSAVTDRMNMGDQTGRFASLAGIPITYHFRDEYVFSMHFPARDLDGLYDEFGLNEGDVIFRLQDRGFMILDASNETWLYVYR
ncbi:hypothetical protein [Salinicoccus albus]|uniref:hypothetical protein n=1 Tax=Salinicoccus albus TaxID=418756 RepID=UPI00036A0CF1|nr:hypothetical protein [Salinicoccus albus]